MSYLKQLEKINLKRPGYFRINDLELDIPPSQITIRHTEYSNSFFALREAAPTTVKSGLKKTTLIVSTIFDLENKVINVEEGELPRGASSKGWDQIARLVIQTRKSPIAIIENEKIRTELLGGLRYMNESSRSAQSNRRKSQANQSDQRLSDPINIGVLIDSIVCQVDTENPSIVHLDITMTHFNYLPYTGNLQYLQFINDEARPSRLPSDVYSSFYESGVNGEFGGLINDPSLDGGDTLSSDMEILYKEYDYIGSGQHPQYGAETKDLYTSRKPTSDVNKSKINRAKKVRIETKKFNKSQRAKEGWKLASILSQGEKEDIVVYRYNKITVPATGNISDGELLLQDISFSLQTNVAYIPMQKYSMPTAQCLGGSVASLRTIIYASPETKVVGAGGAKIPVRTSSRLGNLQRILDQVAENRSKYSRYSRQDFILVKHPIAKLLKYEPYIAPEWSSKVNRCYNPLTDELDDFNFNDYFSCIVKDRLSQTIDGTPFASQFQVDLKEQKINIKRSPTKPLKGKDGTISRTRVMDAIKDIFEHLSNKYQIQKNTQTKELSEKTKTISTGIRGGHISVLENTKEAFLTEEFELANSGAYIYSEAAGYDPDMQIALEVAAKASNSLYLKDYKSIKDIIGDSKIFNLSQDKFLQSVFKKKKISKDYHSETINGQEFVVENDDTSDESWWVMNFNMNNSSTVRQRSARTAITNKIQKEGVLAYEEVGRLLSRLLKLAAKSPDGWGKAYLDMAEPLRQDQEIPRINTYPDLLLPHSQLSPTYYFYEDNFLNEQKAKILTRLLKHDVQDTDSACGKYFYEKDSCETVKSALIEMEQDNSGVYQENFYKKNSANGQYKSDGGSAIAYSATMLDNNASDDNGNTGVHTSADPEVRDYLALKAAVGMVPMSAGISNAMPTYKVFLLEDSLLFPREMTSADKMGNKGEDLEENILDYYKDMSDYFDMSSVIDIRMSKKEDNPADLLIIRVAVTRLDQINTTPPRMTHKEIMDRVRKPRSFKELTRMEQAFAEKGLREGTRIQLRLGKDADPNDLHTEFNGKIVSVSGTDVIEVVCLGNGAELVQDIKNPTKGDVYQYNNNTPQVIRELLRTSSELLSFGTLGPKIAGFEATFIPGFLGGRTITDNIFAPNLFTSLVRGAWDKSQRQDGFMPWAFERGENYGNALAWVGAFRQSLVLLGKHSSATTRAFLRRSLSTASVQTGKLASSIAARNFVGSSTAAAATRLVSKTAIRSIASSVLGKQAAKTIGKGVIGRGLAAAGGMLAVPGFGWALAIWTAVDIGNSLIQGIIGSRYVVYQKTIWEVLQELTLRHPGTVCSVVPYGNRSTIFFGEPHQFYFHRPPTASEVGLVPVASDHSITLFNKSVGEELNGIIDISPTSGGGIDGMGEIITKQRKLKRDSTIAKIENKAMTKEQAAIELREPFRKYHIVSSERDIISNNISVTSRGVFNSIQVAYPESSSDWSYDGTEGYSGYQISDKIQADDDIYPEYIKNKVYTFHNAHTGHVKDMPQRYAKALLCKNLEKTYQGKLVILGRNNIKPHDVVFIYDTYSDIYGPVGVREVVQTVDGNGGWITEIIPKLMVFPDNSAGLLQLNALKKIAHYLGIADSEMYYTNLQRFMPNDFGIANGMRTSSRYSAIASIPRELGLNDDNRNPSIAKDAYGEVETYMQDNGAIPATREAGTGMGTVDEFQFTPSEQDVKATAIATLATLRGVDYAAEKLVEHGVSDKLYQNLSSKVSDTFSTALAGKDAVIGAQGVKGKAGSAAKGVRKTALKLGKVGLSATFGLGMIFAGITTHLILDSAIEGILNFVKYRQPIMFHPLTRNGQPWYGGMRGFKDNTLIESLGNDLQQYKNTSEFVFAMYGRYIDRAWGDN